MIEKDKESAVLITMTKRIRNQAIKIERTEDPMTIDSIIMIGNRSKMQKTKIKINITIKINMTINKRTEEMTVTKDTTTTGTTDKKTEILAFETISSNSN
jgi:hypothetical protein